MTVSPAEAALALHEAGVNVIAAPLRAKSPLSAWAKWQLERVPLTFLKEQFGHGPRNLFVVTGSVSRLCVLDIDTKQALAWWVERLGDELRQTAQVRTGGGGWHFYFRLEEGQIVKGQSGEGWDLKAEGGGVIAPPSVHESGRLYAWAPDRPFEATRALPSAFSDISGTRAPESQSGTRDGLSWLLANPPERGRRNTWLTKVAGHYAKHFPWQDAYELHVEQANATLTEPLDERELGKLKESVWGTEQTKQGRLAPEQQEGEQWRAELLRPAERTGWLVSGRDRILVQTKTKDELGLKSWMNVDLHVLAVVEVEGGERVYEVEILAGAGEPIQTELPASVVADRRQLDRWLANNAGASIGVPDDCWPRRMADTVRLLRYLEAQPQGVIRGTRALGLDDESGAFLTHDEQITEAGPAPFDGARPIVPRTWAPYRYGFGPRAEARAVLREVLTFHFKETVSVFASWWAACFLKPQILARASQFPFMALEAASESGKTTGFFAMMLKLSGNTAGHHIATRAALRDELSAHRSGIVWIDDLDSLEYVGELLRAATVEGGMVKKANDANGQVSTKMRAALVISGESLGMTGQKALMDRAVLLKVESPTGRRSYHNPDVAQWDDIQRVMAQCPDLTDFAGTLVQLALEQELQIKDLQKLRDGAGRHADKLAILRLGARVLDEMLEGRAEWVVDRVDEWVEALDYRTEENALTLKLLPMAKARFNNVQERPEGADRHPSGVSCTPVFVDEDGALWFSPAALAEWWAKEARSRGARVSDRTESEAALTDQARALGLGGKRGEGRKLFRLVGGGAHMYWRMTDELGEEIKRRSEGYGTD